MAGIYIHIPYCLTRCSYCDFYTVIDTHTKSDFTTTLCKEICQSRDYLEGEQIKTIYLGGGTPSVMDIGELQRIFNGIFENFTVEADAEITMEANPDDLTDAYLEKLQILPINRLSLGVQSFDDEDLKFMNRRHTAKEAVEVVGRVQRAGYQNITIDLIYGLPKQTPAKWKKNLDIAFGLGVQHLSCYHLMYEEGTPLYQQLHQKLVTPVTEKVSNKLFNVLIDEMQKAGYEHYEISNFAMPGHYSRHNTAYWTGEKYLGLGPSAHSFNGKTRRWNKKGVHAYIKAIENNQPFFELEELTSVEQFNEYIITRLRTQWGCSIKTMLQKFDQARVNQFQHNIKKWMERGHIREEDEAYTITRSGIMISDAILADIILES